MPDLRPTRPGLQLIAVTACATLVLVACGEQLLRNAHQRPGRHPAR